MAEDIKFAFFATGADKNSPSWFTNLKSAHVGWIRDRLVRIIRLDKDATVKMSLITPPARVRFVHYSFENQAVYVMDKFFGQKDVKDEHKFRRIEEVTDSLSNFARTYSAPLSIVDIYHAVRKAPLNSVIDLSIYSHGFVEGPVLAKESSDNYRNIPFPDGSPQRDPSDTDGRARTDFFPNMGENPAIEGQGKNALNEFAARFAVGAAFRIFGCDVQDIEYYLNSKNQTERLYLFSLAKQVIQQAYTNPRNGTGAIAKQLQKYQRPTQPVTMHMGAEFAAEAAAPDPHGHFSHETADFPLTAAHLLPIHYDDHPLFKGETAPDVTRAYIDIVAFIAQEVKEIYAFKAAQALPNIMVFGALPGTGGLFDYQPPYSLMHVPGYYYHFLRFYKEFLGINTQEPLAERQRNYGIFDAATVAKIIAHSQEHSTER